MNFINTFTADSTTAELAWESLGVTRSQILRSVPRGKEETDRGNTLFLVIKIALLF